MKNGITFVLTFFCAIALTHAAPPSDESLNKMMSALQVETMLNQALEQMNATFVKGMEQGLQESLKGKELTPAQKTAVENFKTKFGATMKDDLSFSKVKDIYIQTYRETLTQEEVDSILTFYKSPAGRAMVEKMPVAMQKASALMQARIGPMTKKLQTMQEEFVKQLATTK
ncbi:MAG: uncharacterized protein QOI04_1175 [Verrucomicrobiota bacterium]|jgi:hypothetical protein